MAKKIQLQDKYGNDRYPITTADCVVDSNGNILSDVLKNTYIMPLGGIPKSDLAMDVQTSLEKADTALQKHQSLAGYATETWVNQQGFLKSASLNGYATKDDIKDFVAKGTTLAHYGITDAVQYATYFPALTTDKPKLMGYCRLADGWKLTGPAMILGTNNYYARIQAGTSSMDNPALYLSVVHAGVEYGWAQVVTDKNFSAYGLAMKTHQNGIDLNEIETGLYDLTGAISNSPLNYGSLLNIKGYFSAQLLFSASGDAAYYRAKSDREVDGTKWRPWRTIIDSNNVDGYVQSVADSRYLKLDSGGTVKGQIYIETSAGDRYIHSKCSTAHIAFGIGSGGNNRGIFDINDGKWWIVRNNSDYTEIVSSTMSLVGKVNVTGVLEARSGITLGSVTRTSWPTEGIAKDSILLPNNAFDNFGKIQFSQLDNALYAAAHRFNITLNGFTSDSKTTLFNGSYEDSIKVPMGQTATIRIDNNGSYIISGYPYGKIVLSFYYLSVPASVSVRVYNTYGTPGWYTLSLSEVRGSRGGVFVFDNTSYYGITEIEITITAKADIEAALAEIDWFLTRAELPNLPVVTKFAIDQELYGRLICKGGITLGNKTITSWDEIKASGDYLSTKGGTIDGNLTIKGQFTAQTSLASVSLLSNIFNVNASLKVQSGWNLYLNGEAIMKWDDLKTILGLKSLAYKNKVDWDTDIENIPDDLGGEIKVVSQTATSGTVGINPNVLNRWSTALTVDANIVINFSESDTEHYMLEFTTGATVPTISLPSGVVWQDGYDITQALTVNRTYQISILNNLAVGGVFK